MISFSWQKLCSKTIVTPYFMESIKRVLFSVMNNILKAYSDHFSLTVCENQMIVCCFDSTVQYGNHTILPLVVKCHHMTLSPWDLSTPIALRFPSSLIVFPTERSGLQRRPQDFSRILGSPLKFLS